MKRKIRCNGEPMTAVVLAGGRGSRMKADKARLAVGGRTLLEHVMGQLAPCFEEVLVSVSKGQKVELERRPRPGESPRVRIIDDEIPGLGPLGGILSGLKAAANDACAVVACDIPDIGVPLLRSLARAAGDAEIAVPVGPAGHFEPLFAIYKKCVVPEIEALLRAGERSIVPLFGRCRTAVLRLEDAGRLRNLNTREDYRAYIRSLAASPTKGAEGAPRTSARKKRTGATRS